jgi:magnesium transporter
MAEVQAADLIEELPPGEAILAAMDPHEARTARTLASYSPDVAGGLVITEFLTFPHATVGDVIENRRRDVETYADHQVQYVYVTRDGERLAGVLRLRDLLWSRPETELQRLMIPEPLAVPDQSPLDDLRDLFDAHQFLGVPVVDQAPRLVGVVRRADVEEALAQQADSDYRKSQGIVGGEELRSMPVLRRSGRRLSFALSFAAALLTRLTS